MPNSTTPRQKVQAGPTSNSLARGQTSSRAITHRPLVRWQKAANAAGSANPTAASRLAIAAASGAGAATTSKYAASTGSRISHMRLWNCSAVMVMRVS